MTQTTSAKGMAEIIGHEAIVPFRYKDSVGVDTFGVGHTASAGAPDPRKMPFAREYPLDEVINVFRRDLRKFEARVRAAVSVPLKRHEFDALVSFDFNTGGVHRAALTRSLNAGNRTAAAQQFMNWSKPPEIRRRRAQEQTLFRDGTYSGRGMANVYPADSRGRVLWRDGRRVDVMPTVHRIQDANAADDTADRDRNRTVGTGAGGAAAQAPQQAPEAVPLPPDLPVDPSVLQTGLAIAGAVLLLIALIFAWRWLVGRRRARRHAAEAARTLKGALSLAFPIDKHAAEAAGLAKGFAPDTE